MYKLISCHYVSDGTRFFTRADDNYENGNQIDKLKNLNYHVALIFVLKPLILYIPNFNYSTYLNSIIVKNIKPENHYKYISKKKVKDLLNFKKENSILTLLKKNIKPNDIYRSLIEKKFVYQVYYKYRREREKILRQEKNNDAIHNLKYDENASPQKKTVKKIFNITIQNELKYFLFLGENKFKTLKQIKKDYEQYYLQKFKEEINFHVSTYHKNLTSKNKINFSLKKTAKYSVYFNNNT